MIRRKWEDSNGPISNKSNDMIPQEIESLTLYKYLYFENWHKKYNENKLV